MEKEGVYFGFLMSHYATGSGYLQPSLLTRLHLLNLKLRTAYLER